jgi:phage shock protein PspC (stress-responsive transcriptional regulator)
MNTSSSRKISRPHDRMLAGVASGLAGYTGVDVLLVRIAFAVLTFVGGAGIPLYLACWLLIPDESKGQSIAADVAADLRGGNQ